MSTNREETDLLTTLDVAKDLGVNKSTICRIAQEYKLGRLLGSQRVFSRKEAAEVKKHCHFKKGNPNFSKKSD